jgi:glycosyltransferase involved in cell wall biosynthesis
MYIFVTYGIPGWRGVQERGLAVASRFKKSEVIFWNIYDSSFIKKAGFKCKTFNPSLTNPSSIKFPPKTRAVIFADLPSNELFTLSVFIAALKKNINIIICDQIYRRGQTNEGVYKNFAAYADLLLLNGLEYFKSEETKKIKIIPPLPPYKIESKKRVTLKKILSKKYGLNQNAAWVFTAAYYKPVLEMTNQALLIMKNENLNIETIFVGADVKKPKKRKKILLLPYLSQADYLKLLEASDFFIGKFGYLQILEAIALGKPVIVAGGGGYVLKMDILDKNLKGIIKYAGNPKILSEILKSLIKNKKEADFLKKKILKLHNGKFGGATLIANYIKNIKKRKKSILKEKKNLLVVVNDEIKKIKNFIKKQSAIYTLGIIAPVSPNGFNPIKRPDLKFLKEKVEVFEIPQKEILPHTFKEIYFLSNRKYDGFVDIIPWYNIWIEHLTGLFQKAQTIFITPMAEQLLFNLLQPFLKKMKLISLNNYEKKKITNRSN